VDGFVSGFIHFIKSIRQPQVKEDFSKEIQRICEIEEEAKATEPLLAALLEIENELFRTGMMKLKQDYNQ